MNRRDFLRVLSLAGAASVIDLNGVGKAMAQSASRTTAKPTLVAVMGGEPAAMLDRMLTEMGGIGRFVKRGNKVVIKPNIGWNRRPEIGANTHPALVGALVQRCLAAGASEVKVFDHTCDEWVQCYSSSGIEAAVEAAGGQMVPANEESYYGEVALPRGVKLKRAKIHNAIRECDVWFNVPVLKHHGGAKMTACLKNYMGIVWDRRVFHSTDLQQCIADANTYAKRPALSIVDAYRVIYRNGPQGKTPEDSMLMKALIASTDPVAADTAALRMFAQAKPTTLQEASHILNAERLRLGTTNLDGGVNVRRVRL